MNFLCFNAIRKENYTILSHFQAQENVKSLVPLDPTIHNLRSFPKLFTTILKNIRIWKPPSKFLDPPLEIHKSFFNISSQIFPWPASFKLVLGFVNYYQCYYLCKFQIITGLLLINFAALQLINGLLSATSYILTWLLSSNS